MIPLPICPFCHLPQATMRHGGAEVFKRHTWFLTEGANGQDGRCPGSLEPVSGRGILADRARAMGVQPRDDLVDQVTERRWA